jgi:hypothetical protein
MDLETHKLEAGLEGMVPTALDERQMERFMTAVGHAPVATDAALVPVEEQLRRMMPLAPTVTLGAQLVEVLERTPFRADEKTVLFPKAPTARPQEKRNRSWLAAAAAVAIAGGISALWLSPDGSVVEPLVQHGPALPPGGMVPTPAAGAFTPASFGSEVQQTRDLGVRWNQEARPMRVLKLVFTDRIQFENGKGEKFEAEVPRVEYIIAPEELD